jgi:YD repeat-containing protein
MYKLFALVLIFLYACSSPHVNSYLNLIENDWKKDKLKGKVKTILTTNYSDGAVFSIMRSVYNEKGFLVSNIEKLASTYVYAYRYDTINSITHMEMMINGEDTSVQQYYYDAKGNLLRVERDGTRTRYKYDEKNRMVEKLDFLGDSLDYRGTWEYLPDGNRRQFWFDSKNVKKAEILINDSVSIYTAFNNGEVGSGTLERKDASGNIIYKQNRLADGSVTNYTKYYYDSFNNEVMSIYFPGEKKKPDTTITNYEYDKTGNWIKFNKTSVREISYW